jgi:hypothetical protein
MSVADCGGGCGVLRPDEDLDLDRQQGHREYDVIQDKRSELRQAVDILHTFLRGI